MAFEVACEKDIPVSGIRNLTKADLDLFGERGLTVKLLGRGVQQDGRYAVAVEPVAVPRDKMVPIRRAGGRYLAEKRKLTLPTRYFKVEEGDALFGAVLDFLKELSGGEGE